jgi:hypothetical protein
MNEIELEYVSVIYQKPIIYLRFKRHIVLGAKEILEIGEAGRKLSNSKHRLVLTDARIPVDISPEGAKAGSNPKNIADVVANAVLIRWLGQRLIANVFITINKPPYPTRVFTDEAKAVKWLLEKYKKATGVNGKELSGCIPKE